MAFFESSAHKAANVVEIDDSSEDDLTLDSQSPYFTQPTQIVSRPTVKSKATIPASREETVEVPASSPFRGNPEPRKSSSHKTGKAGRLANSMTASAAVKKTGTKREYIEIEDDEFEKPLYKGDTSDDEKPARGDIRPSSFQRKESGSAAVAVEKRAKVCYPLQYVLAD